MRRLVFKGIPAALAGFALAACQAESGISGDQPSPAASNSATIASEPVDLSGEWGVSKLHGEDLSSRVQFTAGKNNLYWEPGCAGRETLYRSSKGQVEFYRVQRDEPRIVCDIGYPGDLPKILTSLQGIWTAKKTARGDIELTRKQETLTLEKLPVDKIETLKGEWRVAGIDGQGFDEPYGIALSATDSEIRWEPRCANQSIPYRIVNERFIHVKPPKPSPRPPGADPSVSPTGLRHWAATATDRSNDRYPRSRPGGASAIEWCPAVGGRALGHAVFAMRLAEVWIATFAMLLSACSDQANTDAQATDTTAADAANSNQSGNKRLPQAPSGPALLPQADIPPVLLPVGSIEGFWVVDSIGAESLGPREAIVLTIGPDRIDFENCQLVSWNYELNDGTLRTRRTPAITIDIRPEPLPCAAPFSPRVTRIVETIDSARRVDPASNGALRLSGKASFVTLVSQ